MIIVFSGEGPSDLGHCTNMQGHCTPPAFQIGPMAWLVDRMITERMGYSLLETTPDCCIYLSEKRLEELDAIRKNQRRKLSLPGAKHQPETGYYYINAWMLGAEAIRLANQSQDQAVAILFRDSDGTRSTLKGLWERKWDSMISGFARSTLCERGVPMLPKPKSEAWLLCAAKEQPYQHCAQLEDLPGNDDAPRSAKGRLDAALAGATSAQEQLDWLRSHDFDQRPVSEQMPSFAAFSQKLEQALSVIMQDSASAQSRETAAPWNQRAAQAD